METGIGIIEKIEKTTLEEAIFCFNHNRGWLLTLGGYY